MYVNQKQRWVIWAMGCLLLGILAYPPWWWSEAYAWDYVKGVSSCFASHKYYGGKYYDWYFAPPPHSLGRSDCGFDFGIEYWRWATEIGLVVIVGGGLLWVVKDRRPSTHG
jgi:hypothetical protein